MSPGMRRISTKTSAAAPARVGIARSSRCTMYRYIAPPDGESGLGCSTAWLLIQPNVREILVDVVARTDLPALHVGPVGDDPIPPRRHDRVGLSVEDVGLAFAPHAAQLLVVCL